MCDIYRIGNIFEGIDFFVVNQLIMDMAKIRQSHCSTCAFIRICDACLLVLDLNEPELEVYCKNERLHSKLQLQLLSVLAEADLL